MFKNLIIKLRRFSRGNIHKYTSISPNGKTHNQSCHVKINRILDIRSFRRVDRDTDHYLVAANGKDTPSVSNQTGSVKV